MLVLWSAPRVAMSISNTSTTARIEVWLLAPIVRRQLQLDPT